jgi:hypothetical protein
LCSIFVLLHHLEVFSGLLISVRGRLAVGESSLGLKTVLVSLLFFGKPFLVELSDLIEELITVDGKLVDNVLNYRLGLHTQEHSTTNLLREDLLAEFEEFNDYDSTSVMVVQKVHNLADIS